MPFRPLTSIIDGKLVEDPYWEIHTMGKEIDVCFNQRKWDKDRRKEKEACERLHELDDAMMKMSRGF